MKHAPDTFETLLANWTTPELSAELGVPYVTARKMRERKSMGITHWPALIKAAQSRGIALDFERLVAMRRRKVAA